MEEMKDNASRKVISDTGSQISVTHVGRENLADAIPPHESYEGRHRYDPSATWTEAEERKVVRKTDLLLLSWICIMFFGLQLDRGNLSNATADNLLVDLKLTSDDYNNVSLLLIPIFDARINTYDSTGNNNSIAGLLYSRVPRSIPYQTLRIQKYPPHHDDALGYRLYVSFLPLPSHPQK